MRLLCPSMMCADFSNLAQEMKKLDNGIDIYHMDIMDGNYVPNMTLGVVDIKAVRKNTNKMIDAHLMIDQPLNKLDYFINAGVDLIYVHHNSGSDPIECLKYLRSKGVKSGLAINPETTVQEVENCFPYCDYLLVMTVHPGFAGQKYLEEVNPKIEQLNQLKAKYGYKMIMDGACSPAIIKQTNEMGIDGYVLGTSALFNKNESYDVLLQGLKEL